MKTQVIKILDEIEKRLNNIKEMNGYNTTAKSIKRASLKPFNSFDLPAINFWATGVLNSVPAYKIDERSVSIYIEYHTKTRDTDFIDTCEQLTHDIMIAINRNANNNKPSDNASYNLGGLIDNLILNEYSYQISEGQSPFCGVLVQLTASYKTKRFEMET